jgi:hypothetical protein
VSKFNTRDTHQRMGSSHRARLGQTTNLRLFTLIA